MVELFGYFLFRRYSSLCFFYRVNLLLSTLRVGQEQFNTGVYICTSFSCLHTGDSTTSMLSAQRVSPLRFVGINKQLIPLLRHLSANYRIDIGDSQFGTAELLILHLF